jgi:diketogulonate reductase-like aldo/keto reductase
MTEQTKWWHKYRVPELEAAPESGNLYVLDFSKTKDISPEDLKAAKASAAREAAARPQALLAAERARYHHANVPYHTLKDGNRIPMVGLGTWKAEKGQVRTAVHAALRAGYRHIDCASVYANEDEVGDALHFAIRRGHIPREELFICSKVWNNEHGTRKVREACLKSLKALKLDYLDLYLIHWPVTGNVGNHVTPPIKETWQALESLVKDGLVKSIGVSNFSIKKLKDILSYATIPPVVCQVECHPYHRNEALIQWCKENDIHVTAYSPLGSPDSASIFPRKIPAVLLEDPVVNTIAAILGRNAGQVLIRWALQRGTSVIPKSTSDSRIQGNLDVLDWDIPDEDFRALTGLAFQQRMVNGALWLNPKGPYKTMEDLWDEEVVECSQDALDLHLSTAGTCTSTAVGSQQHQQQQQVVKLSNGAEMPLLGLGTWKSAPGQVRTAVEAALRSGLYKHIDCASIYANEHEVGDALKAVMDGGVVERKELFITSKLWNTDHAAAAVEKACKRSLKNLKLDYLDLYLIHWPVSGNKGPEVVPSIKETWHEMEGLVKSGLVKSIGVSNFSIKKFKDILSYATIPPVVCQVECHPYHRNESLIKWCKDNGIHVTAYSPLGSPDSASMFSREAPKLMEDPIVGAVAASTGRSVAHVLLKWAIQRGTSVLPKSTNPERIKANADVWDWELGGDDFRALSSLAHQQRMVDGSFWLSEEGPYRTLKEFWDE